MHKANIALKEYQDYERLAELKRVAGRAQDREVAAAKALFDIQTKDENEPSLEIINQFKEEQENMLRKILNVEPGDSVENSDKESPTNTNEKISQPQNTADKSDIHEDNVDFEHIKNEPFLLGSSLKKQSGETALNSNLAVSIKKKQKIINPFAGYDSD